MKRLFSRAAPEAVAVGLLGLLLIGVNCAPDNSVKAGAPVLKTLTIVEPMGSARHDVSDSTAACESAGEGMDCDPKAAVCQLGEVICNCVAKDMCDPTIKADDAKTGGTLNCTFPPMSMVVATFDRLLDTAPFEAKTTVAALAAMPATTAVAATDYTANGSSIGLVFPMFFNISGPSIAMVGSPALPTDATVSFTLDKTTVRAKDGKTAFTGAMLLAGGAISFKTGPFSGGITVPAPPPPMGGGGMMPMGCPPPPGGDSDAGADGATDAETEAGATEGGVDAGVDAISGGDSSAADAGTDGATVDAPAMPPSTDVPADMNMAPIVITFSNPVGMDITTHLTMTEDGKPFTGFALDMAQMFPSAVVTIVPSAPWAAGKTYTITVDANAADVLGKKLGAPVDASFTMSAP
ncbi:MAG TPA: Ig-like domain-containing protein [Polyangia bacterium]|nr:Ig-like domain-containing protein [Polyangia bacterium]